MTKSLHTRNRIETENGWKQNIIELRKRAVDVFGLVSPLS
jgi:hypothetical protein